MPPRKSDTLSKDIIAQYMTAELDSMTQRALQYENVIATKINFFLLLVTALGGGLLVAVNVPALVGLLIPISSLIALLLFVFGWVTLLQGLDLSASSTFMYRRMGRIRQWFLAQDETLARYMPFTPGDDRPWFFVKSAPLRSIETTLLLINSGTAGTGQSR